MLGDNPVLMMNDTILKQIRSGTDLKCSSHNTFQAHIGPMGVCNLLLHE